MWTTVKNTRIEYIVAVFFASSLRLHSFVPFFFLLVFDTHFFFLSFWNTLGVRLRVYVAVNNNNVFIIGNWPCITSLTDARKNYNFLWLNFFFSNVSECFSPIDDLFLFFFLSHSFLFDFSTHQITNWPNGARIDISFTCFVAFNQLWKIYLLLELNDRMDRHRKDKNKNINSEQTTRERTLVHSLANSTHTHTHRYATRQSNWSKNRRPMQSNQNRIVWVWLCVCARTLLHHNVFLMKLFGWNIKVYRTKMNFNRNDEKKKTTILTGTNVHITRNNRTKLIFGQTCIDLSVHFLTIIFRLEWWKHEIAIW